MKILLIDILRSGLEEIWPAAEHSLGLMYISATLKRHLGDEVDVVLRSLISLPHHPDADREAMARLLEESAPDVVGLRSLTLSSDCVHTTAQVVKEWRSDCLLIAGGPYPTDDPGDVLGSGLVDIAVVGEGEQTMLELMRRLLAGEPYGDISGIAYRENGSFVRNAPREVIMNLDGLPFPDYSIVDLDAFSNRYLSFAAKISSPHANIMTSRGCPYRCAYCHNILGKKFRPRSAENVFEEIRWIHDEMGIRDFQVIDDIFNLDMDRAKRICDLIIKSGMKLTFAFPNAIRSDRIDEELVEKMALAGTRFTAIAIETASRRLQKLIRKNLDLDVAFRTIELCTKAGIVTRGFFMLGFPTETEEEALSTIEYAKASSLVGATFFQVVYYPGTKLYELAQSLGFFKDTHNEIRRDYVQVSEGPYDFSAERMVELKKKAITEFAFTRERVMRAISIMPPYFSQREIDGLFMAYVVSSQARWEDIEDPFVKTQLKRHFIIADRFSRKREFYV
ncbi:MAG: radical SAM protein [Bacteroidetes bacterium]|nr:radical SAM protein [Bacteroidota bacterium]